MSSIEFANRDDGWLYGGDLWSTHDGGRPWHRSRAPSTLGTAKALAVAGSTVYVVGATCNTAGQMCQFGRLFQDSGGTFRVEITEILGDTVDLVPRPTGVPDVEETGDTLVDNARLKAL